MNRKDLLYFMLENKLDWYFDKKENIVFMTLGFYEDIQLIIKKATCKKNMVKALQCSSRIANEELASVLINGVLKNGKNIEVLQ